MQTAWRSVTGGRAKKSGSAQAGSGPSCKNGERVKSAHPRHYRARLPQQYGISRMRRCESKIMSKMLDSQTPEHCSSLGLALGRRHAAGVERGNVLDRAEVVEHAREPAAVQVHVLITRGHLAGSVSWLVGVPSRGPRRRESPRTWASTVTTASAS